MELLFKRTYAAKSRNLDIADSKDNVYWLLDFGIQFQKFHSKELRKLAEYLNEKIKEEIGASKPLDKIAYEAIKKTREYVISGDLINVYNSTFPVFSMIMVKIKDNVLDYLLIGDNLIVVENKCYIRSKPYASFRKKFFTDVKNVGIDKSLIVDIQKKAIEDIFKEGKRPIVANLNEDSIKEAYFDSMYLSDDDRVGILTSNFVHFAKWKKVGVETLKLTNHNLRKAIYLAKDKRNYNDDITYMIIGNKKEEDKEQEDGSE